MFVENYGFPVGGHIEKKRWNSHDTLHVLSIRIVSHNTVIQVSSYSHMLEYLYRELVLETVFPDSQNYFHPILITCLK